MFQMRLNTPALALSVILFGPALLGQVAPIVRQGTTELGAFIGSSYGTDAFRVMGGGNVSYAVTRMFMPYGEFSYFPGLPRQAPGGVGADGNPIIAKYDLPLADFHAGVHVRFRLAEHRFVPYGVFGVGGVHNYATTYNFSFLSAGSVRTQPVQVAADTSFAVNFGGGIRYYINQKYGVRVEAKVYKATGTINDVFSKYEFGFFYQIR